MNRLILLLLVTLAFVNIFAQTKTTRHTSAKPSKPDAAAIPEPYREILQKTEQAIVVTTPGWNVVDGSLIRYEKQDGKWKQVGDKIPIVVAKNGLGWDALIELPSASGEPVKKEGDGRSPAGVFKIPELFGFDPESPDAKMPYHPLTEYTECVDDVNSRSYNQVVDLDKMSGKDWDSSEKMRTIEVYLHGAVVDYNPAKIPGAGSCIFLHIWKGSGRGTAGCTAMEEDNLKSVLGWLDEKKNPVLIQFPAPLYQRIRESWQLP